MLTDELVVRFIMRKFDLSEDQAETEWAALKADPNSGGYVGLLVTLATIDDN